MTLEVARSLKAGDYVYHVENKNADGTPMRALVTSVKKWIRNPARLEVHVKHGLRDYAVFTEDQLKEIEKGFFDLRRREMILSVKIRTGNDAFFDNERQELARILRKIADEVEDGKDVLIPRDENGNVVGVVEVR